MLSKLTGFVTRFGHDKNYVYTKEGKQNEGSYEESFAAGERRVAIQDGSFRKLPIEEVVV